MTVQRKGFSFIELLVVFVLFGLVFAMALPRFTSMRTNYQVHSARDRVAASLATARAAAIRRGRNAQMVRSGNSIAVFSSNGTAVPDTILRPYALDNEYGVTLTSTADTVQFNARGFSTLTSTQVFRVTLGTATDSVCISRRGIVNTKGCL